MAGDTENPRIWINATALVAPVGTTAPTDVATPWAAGWDDLGLLSEDGMTESRTDTIADHYAWGGILVRTTRSKHKRSFKITALEDNPTAWGLLNPGSSATSASGVTTRTVKVPGSDIRAFGLETLDGSITRRRIMPRAEVISVSDTKSSDAEMTMFEMTVNIYPASDGTLYLDITDDPQAVP